MIETLKTKTHALSAQIQASTITAQQKASQADRQKAELEVNLLYYSNIVTMRILFDTKRGSDHTKRYLILSMI